MNRSLISIASSLVLIVAASAADSPSPAGIKDPKDALEGIPRDVLQDLSVKGPKLAPALVKATSIVEKNAKGKPATFKIAIRRVDQFQDQNNPGVRSYRVIATTTQIRQSGTVMPLYITAVVESSQDAKAAKLREGDKVTVSGTVNYANILDRNGAELHLYLEKAKLD